jgi:excisionase family DNA binding protein
MKMTKSSSHPMAHTAATGARLLTVQTCADQLGLSVWTVRLWAYNGKIASHKLGSRLMVSQSEMDRVISESERPRVRACPEDPIRKCNTEPPSLKP